MLCTIWTAVGTEIESKSRIGPGQSRALPWVSLFHPSPGPGIRAVGAHPGVFPWLLGIGFPGQAQAQEGSAMEECPFCLWVRSSDLRHTGLIPALDLDIWTFQMYFGKKFGRLHARITLPVVSDP